MGIGPLTSHRFSAMIALPTLQNINQAADIIKNGGLIAYPTETVYGLGTDPHNDEAVQKIFTAKGRAEDKGIILLIRGVDDLSMLVRVISPTAQILIRGILAGTAHPCFSRKSRSFTRLARRTRYNSSPPFEFARCLPTALCTWRTSHEYECQSLCRTIGAFGMSEVENALGEHLDLILDGGPSTSTLPSTLVDVSTDRAILLREGAVSAQKLRSHIHHYKK